MRTVSTITTITRVIAVRIGRVVVTMGQVRSALSGSLRRSPSCSLSSFTLEMQTTMRTLVRAVQRSLLWQSERALVVAGNPSPARAGSDTGYRPAVDRPSKAKHAAARVVLS